MFKTHGTDKAQDGRIRGYLNDARQRWKFLSEADCLAVEDCTQLATTVASRHGLSPKRAAAEVAEWKRGKQL